MTERARETIGLLVILTIFLLALYAEYLIVGAP